MITGKTQTSNKDWKNNLSEIMTENKLFRLKFLNDMLPDICESWVKHFKEFDGATAGWKKDEIRQIVTVTPVYIITAMLPYRFPDMPFRIKLSFDTNQAESKIVLKMSYAIDFNARIYINSDDDPVVYKHEELDEEEMIFAEYILQIINISFNNWLKNMKKRFND